MGFYVSTELNWAKQNMLKKTESNRDEMNFVLIDLKNNKHEKRFFSNIADAGY